MFVMLYKDPEGNRKWIKAEKIEYFDKYKIKHSEEIDFEEIEIYDLNKCNK